LGAGYALALDLKFQAECDALVIRGAAEGVGFKTLPVQPFSNARHYAESCSRSRWISTTYNIGVLYSSTFA
jgi:hypothetical protein